MLMPSSGFFFRASAHPAANRSDYRFAPVLRLPRSAFLPLEGPLAGPPWMNLTSSSTSMWPFSPIFDSAAAAATAS
jgi:hypothetical protein